MSFRSTRYALIALATFACRGAEDSSAADSSVIRTDTVAATGTVKSPADSGASVVQGTPNPSLDPTDTVPVKKAPPTAVSIVDTASLPTIQKIVAHHPQTVDSTITVMTDELKRLNRQPSALWTALQDSVKKDLDKLASLSDGQLVTFFREHYARFTRFKSAHRSLIDRTPNVG